MMGIRYYGSSKLVVNRMRDAYSTWWMFRNVFSKLIFWQETFL